MEENNIPMLEDGEIHDQDDPYTPLERPTNNVTQQKPPVIEDPDSEDEVKSSSDSNSDDDTPKRQKINPKFNTFRKDAKKMNTIWCKSVQEDVLVENLVNFDVSYVDRSRHVETYNTSNNKRNYSDRNNKMRLPTKRNDTANKDTKVKVVPRYILDLKFGVDDSTEEIAKDMANKLLEEKEDLMKLVVEIAGKEKAIELFKETQRIELEGGMMILNYQRRRTPGGVFFYLVKNDTTLTREQQTDIFSNDKHQFKQTLIAQRKLKHQLMKEKIKSMAPKRLPELSTRSELELQNVQNADIDVKNPPPSPATDSISNSPDDVTNVNNTENTRSVVDYDDCVNLTNDVEFF